MNHARGEKSFQFAQFGAFHGETRRHRVATALDQQARLTRGDDRSAQIGPAHRTPRSRAELAHQTDHARRAVVAFLQA